MKPAIRIVFAPLYNRSRSKAIREGGYVVHGETVGRTIKIDPRTGTTILDTLLHEMTHVRHPDWNETLVRSYTAAKLKKMSWKEKAAHLKLLGSAIIEGEEK